MYQLNIYGCDNPYETSPIRNLYQRFGSDPGAWNGMITDYRTALKERSITVLHVVIQKIDTDNGTIEIVTNEVGRVEPRKRTVINPAAEAIVKAKKAGKIPAGAVITGNSVTFNPDIFEVLHG